MLFPSKVIPYNESILPKFPLVIHYLERGPKRINDIYKHMKGNVKDISELFEVLDCLYALGKITLDDNNLVRIGKEDEK